MVTSNRDGKQNKYNLERLKWILFLIKKQKILNYKN